MEAYVGVDKQATDWRFEPATFAGALLDRWPDARLRQIDQTDRKAACEWSIPLPHSPGKMLNGFLSRTGTRLAIKGTIEDCVMFALWVRMVVPAEVGLRLWDDQHPDSVVVIGIGSGFCRALRMVLGEWCSCLAIARMVRPSRCS